MIDGVWTATKSAPRGTMRRVDRPALTSLTYASTDTLTNVADLLTRTLGLAFEQRLTWPRTRNR